VLKLRWFRHHMWRGLNGTAVVWRFLRRHNFTWKVAGTSVRKNPRWVRFHRIFVYTCKQSNIMCSCCVWPHGNGLVTFYSLQKLFKLCFFVIPLNLFCVIKVIEINIWIYYYSHNRSLIQYMCSNCADSVIICEGG
jgi:hypothetical protein